MLMLFSPKKNGKAWAAGMLEKHYIQRKTNTDLNVYRCGVESCPPGHAWGPGVRDHYLIHLIREGRGTLVLDGQPWHLSAGDGFMVPPEVPVFWQAEETAPWTYAWVGFHGLRAASLLERTGLRTDAPVFRHEGDASLMDALSALVTAARQEESGAMTTPGELLLTGHLYLFLSKLCARNRMAGPDRGNTEDKARHVRHALAWLTRHYPENVRISDLSHALGLDRSYLSTLIRKGTGASPQTHLIRIRMERAVFLMGNPQLGIADIARSVGYADPAQFSKTFRHLHGLSPVEFRRKQDQEAFCEASSPNVLLELLPENT